MANTKFDSKSFNPEAFGRYIDAIPNTTKTELANSGAVGGNQNARDALATQTGSLYARVPYFGRISGATSQNNDGGTDITSTTTTTFEQGFVTASRMDSWTERSFSANITAGVNFMDAVGAQIAEYKMEVQQGILLSMLNGAFSMSTDGGTTAADAAAEFLAKHVYDISDASGDDGCVGAGTLNSAIQQACGDNKSVFTLVIMHSAVATNLENLQLLKYWTQTDANGIERPLLIATWNGRTVLIDDGMPTEDVDAGDDVDGNGYTKYTTYILGQNAIVLDAIADSVPYEMSRDPRTNGGQDTLYVRDRYICGIDGLSFEKPASVSASATNDDLADGANWNVINDGETAINTKAIPLCKIVSRG